MSQSTPEEILGIALERARVSLAHPIVQSEVEQHQVEYVVRSIRNRAGTRMLMSCLLAKLDKPKFDPRKPYTEIGTKDSFSGRKYDEKYIGRFVIDNHLPCNSTTAFLTPAFRNIGQALTTDVDIIGRPRQIYVNVIQLLNDVHKKRVSAEDLLAETIRLLLVVRNEKNARMETLLAGLRNAADALPLSSEAILKLMGQHLALKNSARLPVLIVAAAYKAAGPKLGEKVLPLQGHNAADEQTGAMGDIEITLINDDQVVTVYEMKKKRVIIEDIERALQKIAAAPNRIHNYIFITTDVIDDEVRTYAYDVYERTGGTEVAILDCLGFLRHFLHLFHRARITFLDSYQELVLLEPDSAVSQPLKEAFLALRQAAEAEG